MDNAPTISELQAVIHKTAVEKGWWKDGERNIGELLFLTVGELAEGFEHLRNNHAVDEVFLTETNKPDGFPVELADAVIRILDLCGFYEIDLESAILNKMQFNETREWRHGNKKA